ncbi:MAG: hypothetical protein ACI9OJ_004669 [Myxococcota bacterium]
MQEVKPPWFQLERNTTLLWNRATYDVAIPPKERHMGLLNKRNIAKAKKLAFKNKDKVAAGVRKATETVDKKTGGKYAAKLKKVDDAAAKFAGDQQAADADAPDADVTDTDPDGNHSAG